MKQSCRNLNAEDGEDGDTPVLRDAVVYTCPRGGSVSRPIDKERDRRGTKGQRTLIARLEEVGAPLDFSAPPNLMSFSMATGQSALYEPVSAEVVSILSDLVPLLRRLLLRCSIQFGLYMCVNKHIEMCEEGDVPGVGWGWWVMVGGCTYPTNHAPLSAWVPFCRQARKWCPPATLSQHVPQTGK